MTEPEPVRMNEPVPFTPISSPVPKPTLAQVIIDKIREGATLEETKEYYRFLREIQADEAKMAFDADFVKLEFPEIPRLGTIDMGRGGMQRKYALWEDINSKIEPVLRAQGFRLRFDIVEENETSLALEAILVHRSGHSIRTRKKLPLDKSGAKNIVQQFGSTQSYAQRYAAIALLNLTSRGEDDDAASTASTGSTNGPRSSDEFFVTPEQIAELERLIKLTGRTVERFCALCIPPLTELAQIPASQYESKIAFLKNHIPKDAT